MTISTAPARMTDGRNVITHSRMTAAKTCLRKHWFQYEFGIRPTVTAKPLRQGSAYHLGLDLLAQGVAVAVADAVAQATADYEHAPAWCISDELIEEWKTEGEIVRRMIAGYARRWPNSQFEIVATEQTFELDIRNPGDGRKSAMRVGGRIDKIVRLPTGQIAVMEHKTVAEDLAPDSNLWSQLRIDQQISLYLLAARALGHDAETVLYDVARKPAIRPRKLTKAEVAVLGNTGEYCGVRMSDQDRTTAVVTGRETVGLYGERLARDLADNPDYYYAQREIPRLAQDLDEFAWELWQYQGIISDCRRYGRWPRNTNACLTMGTCPFFKLCTGGYDTASGEIPEGFDVLDNVNPELLERE